MSWRTHIASDPYSDTIAIYFLSSTERGPHALTVKDGVPIMSPYEEGGMPEPFVKISRRAGAEDLLRSLYEELVRHLGLPNNDFVKGELLATKAHLQDMRDLVGTFTRPKVIKERP